MWWLFLRIGGSGRLTLGACALGFMCMAAGMGVTNPVGLFLCVVPALLVLALIRDLASPIVLIYFAIGLVGVVGEVRVFTNIQSFCEGASSSCYYWQIVRGGTHLAFLAILFCHYRTLQSGSLHRFRLVCASLAAMLLLSQCSRLFPDSELSLDYSKVFLGFASLLFAVWPTRWTWLGLVFASTVLTATFVFSVQEFYVSLSPDMSGLGFVYSWFLAACSMWIFAAYIELYRVNLSLGDDGRVLFGRR